MTPARISAARKKGRPTIGLLIGRLGDIGYAANVWPGVADVAAERDANLVCFVGGALNAPHEFDFQRNVVYDLAGPENVDGLVAMSGSLGQFIGSERLLEFFERFDPLPIISIAMELKGVPSVLVDNTSGMRKAVSHLIEVHGARRIAFLRGPATNSEAEERYRAYRETLDAHHLPLDPEIVADGNYLAPAGAEAIRLFLEERKAAFDAVASANDEMLLGAVAALRRRGKRVPEDVRVVGFDNVEEARYNAPPLTTIRQPFYEQGRKAAEILMDLLAGKKVPPKTVMPTELVIRQSCGCFPPAAQPAPAQDLHPAARKGGKAAAPGRREWLAEMALAAGASAPKEDPGWAARLFDAFARSLRSEKSRAEFLQAWDEVLRRAGAGGGEVMEWSRVLSVLRRASENLPSGPAPEGGGLFWNQAELMIGEAGCWSQVYRRLQADRRAFDFMTVVSEPLMTAFDIPGLADVVAEQLPRMGIRNCYLSLYERAGEGGEKTPADWSRLILAYNEKGRLELEPGGRRFPSRELIPRQILPRSKRYAVMLEPLHFRDEQPLGFILFEPLQSEAGPLREAFSRQISTALKGAMLLQERRQAEETLRTGEQKERFFQERLRILLEVSNELSRAESVDALCRRAVELGLEKLGFDRMGIWFHRPEQEVIEGSFGTDAKGKVIDERGIRVKAEYSPNDILRQTRPITLLQTKVKLRDGEGNTVGNGMRAEAAMWDGERTIGLVAVDNLLHGRPLSDHDCELLNSFACNIGYLCSRKRTEEILREGEQKERSFQERLRTLLEVSNELSRAESVDALCRRAVELGRSRLGFDRLGIWFSSPDHKFVLGSWGTDDKGNLKDERNVRLPAGTGPNEPLFQKHPTTFRQNDVALLDSTANVVGRGMHAQAPMWDGEKTIGLVATDNLLLRRPITDQDADILNLYASTLGYLCSRKQAEDTLRGSEQKERDFQVRLRTLLEVSNELSREESVDDLCRRAVELGRSQLGFDRMGIWFYDPATQTSNGSFGTGAGGETTDEREIHVPADYPPEHILLQPRPVTLLQADVDLRDMNRQTLGRGMRADAAMWNGEKTIGWISVDNLLKRRPITEQDCELINLYASTLGNLVSRKRTEEQLRASEQRERRLQERLRILLEIANGFSRAESVDDLCRQAVELARSRLGFDRVGIWFFEPETGQTRGSFGTDANGETVDERNFRRPIRSSPNDIYQQTSPVALLDPDIPLLDAEGKVLGRGMRAQAAMWNGEKVIGYVSIDNLIHKNPVTIFDCEILNLFASTLGYLCSQTQAEETLRESEQRERSFQERLRILLEISNELSRAESVDDLCRQAVELGRSRLDFDRLGIWFYSPHPGFIDGSYGTDAEGKTVDEREFHWASADLHLEILNQTRPVALLNNDVDLSDGKFAVLGRGSVAQAAMWNGEEVIGYVSMDNLLRHRPITPYDCELLNSFASTLGYLCSRKRVEETLRASEQKERSFQERLRILLEIGNDLSRADTVDGLCRQAVELARLRLGFDRLGIWFHYPEQGIIQGSYGTDARGGLTDERNIRLNTEGLEVDILKQTRPIAIRWADAVLRDGYANEIARGEQAQAAIWNGEKVIGFVSIDNLLRHRPITDTDCELLNMFASSLGYLVSRKQAEEGLREYSEHLEDKVDERTRALQQAQENLVRQEKLAVLGQLAATVSHEIRNPLATIRVSTTAVEQKVRDKGFGVERSLDRIQRNITRCDTIISELLEYTRMPDLNFQTVDADDWLNRLLDEQILPEGIRLRRDLSSGARVPLDSERFRRVIINLLDNARQAMLSAPDAGGAEKELAVATKIEGDWLRIAVRDSGIGIPQGVLPHIFEPLFSTKGFGVGLGLPIVKGIVEQHGGEIAITSVEGQGTEAAVRLPMTPKGRKK